jgi:hypothetical protein
LESFDLAGWSGGVQPIRVEGHNLVRCGLTGRLQPLIGLKFDKPFEGEKVGDRSVVLRPDEARVASAFNVSEQIIAKERSTLGSYSHQKGKMRGPRNICRRAKEQLSTNSSPVVNRELEQVTVGNERIHESGNLGFGLWRYPGQATQAILNRPDKRPGGCRTEEGSGTAE